MILTDVSHNYLTSEVSAEWGSCDTLIGFTILFVIAVTTRDLFPESGAEGPRLVAPQGESEGGATLPLVPRMV